MPSKSAVKYAKALRNWQQEHPVADIALGFIPGVGQALGAATAGAAYLDPDASSLERGMATAGILPIGKLGGAVRKIVIGPKGATAYAKDYLEMAKELLRRGEKSMDEIEEYTGWWKDANGHWKTEISDHTAQANMRALEESGGVASADQFLRHDSIYERYPDMKDMDVMLGTSPGFAGSYKPRTDTVRMSPTARAPDNTAIHEFQHAVQNREGWLPKNLRNYDMNSPIERKDYLGAPHEVEARVTAMRRQWTPGQRAAIPFRKMYDAEMRRIRETSGRASTYPSSEERKAVIEALRKGE